MEDITVTALKKRMDQGESIILIDVREPYEHEEFNIGGKLIPLGELPGKLANLEAHKDEEIVVERIDGLTVYVAKK